MKEWNICCLHSHKCSGFWYFAFLLLMPKRQGGRKETDIFHFLVQFPKDWAGQAQARSLDCIWVSLVIGNMDPSTWAIIYCLPKCASARVWIGSRAGKIKVDIARVTKNCIECSCLYIFIKTYFFLRSSEYSLYVNNFIV